MPSDAMSTAAKSPELKALIEANRYINVDPHEWWDYTYDDFKTQMAERGITVTDIRFSGFSSQGDGASFTGHVEGDELPKFLQVNKLAGKYTAIDFFAKLGELGITVWRTSSRYAHYNTTDVEVTDDIYNPFAESSIRHTVYSSLEDQLLTELDAFRGEVKEIMHDHMQDLYKALNDEYDYLTSDEAVLETLVCNDMIPEELNTTTI